MFCANNGFSGGSCMWIILILILVFCCGGNNGCSTGCANNNCGCC